ncbi:MAG: methyl-accepting chemotaxis protein [Aminipila sp.]
MYKNLKVKNKLTLSFTVVMAFFIIILFISIGAVTIIENKIHSFYYTEHKNSVTQMEIRKNIEKLDKDILMTIHNTNPMENNKYQQQVNESIELVMNDTNKLKRNFRNQDLMKKLNVCINKVLEQEMVIMTYSLKGDNVQAFNIYNSKYAQASNELHSVLDQIGRFSEQSATNAFEKIMAIKVYTINMIIITSLICVALSILSVIMLTNSFVKPIKQIVQASDSISQGNLTFGLTSKSKDEFGEVIKAFDNMSVVLKYIISDLNYILNQMAQGNFSVEIDFAEKYVGDYKEIFLALKNLSKNINNTLVQIHLSSKQVTSSSKLFFNDSQAFSSGAIEQAAAIQELSATVVQIKTQTENTAGNALVANSLTEEVGAAIIESDQYMEDMLCAISEISHKSKEVIKIIKTIDDLSFQTNILALNAAVEAARAGMAGKGFSVVADEVRKLAKKSTEAANNSTILIESSINAVNKGINIAGKTAEALKTVVEKSAEAVDIIDKISIENVQQSDAIKQLSEGIQQITSVVQINSTTAEQSANTSRELHEQAEILKVKIAQFKLKEIS